MNNLLDGLIGIFGNNKKHLLIALIAYVIVTLGIIVYIWWPEQKDYLEYESVDITAKQQSLSQSYIDEISLLFRTGDKQAIKDLISNDYTKYVDKSKDEIVSELEKNGFFSLYSEIRGVDLYVDGNTYVYTTTIYYENNSKKINIVETYPHNYTLVFDDFYKYDEINKSVTKQNIKFTIVDVYRNLKYIQMNVKIENQNSSYARFDFNSSSGVQAVLKDGKKYDFVNLVSTSNYEDVESNMTINKVFVFEVPAQLQNNIEYIVFNGVVMEFSTADLKIEI